ncbi:MAG: hypothetical protein ABR964_00430 [Tepidisphaeraceae bacterium]|jgi:hypothetical protein
MAASVFHSGYYGTAALGSSELPITKWEVQPTVELTPFKNSKSGGYVLREATFKDCTVEIDIDFDFGNNPFAAPLSINVGAVLSNVKLCLHQSSAGALDGLCWSFSSLIVDGTPQQLVVDGKITTKVLCKGSGSFTYPS